MSDFSFMKTGFNNLVDEGPSKEELMELSSIVMAFTKNGLKNSDIYVKHAGRNGFTPQDIKIGLQLEVFEFMKREDTPKNIKDTLEWLKKDIEEYGDFDERSEDSTDAALFDYLFDEESGESEESSEDDSMLDESEEEAEEIMEFTKSTCTCVKCNQMNAISNLWDMWEPDTSMNKILKNAIDNIKV